MAQDLPRLGSEKSHILDSETGCSGILAGLITFCPRAGESGPSSGVHSQEVGQERMDRSLSLSLYIYIYIYTHTYTHTCVLLLLLSLYIYIYIHRFELAKTCGLLFQR